MDKCLIANKAERQDYKLTLQWRDCPAGLPRQTQMCVQPHYKKFAGPKASTPSDEKKRLPPKNGNSKSS
jgi:hypothetical protein